MKLVGLGTYAATNIDFITALVVDDQRLEWTFTFRDTGVPNLAQGQYAGLIHYQSASEGPTLAAVVLATVS